MPALANAAANKLLDAQLRGITYVAPTGLWVALFTTPVTSATLGAEVTGGSYARKQVNFNAAVSGSATNTADIAILGMPAVTVVSVAVMNAASGGSAEWYGTVSKTTNAGDTFTIRAGDLNLGYL